MAVLSAVFKGVDEMSGVLENMASQGEQMASQLESAGAVADEAFERAVTGAEAAALAAENAASSTDFWTEAVGSYDKSALEAIHSTEELVEMGFKTEDALSAAASAAEEQTDAIEKGTSAMQEFRNTIEEQESELATLEEAYMGIVLTMGENSEEAMDLKSEIDDLSFALDSNRTELENLEGALSNTTTAAEDQATAVEKGVSAMQEFRDTISGQEAELENLQEAYMGIALTMGEGSEEAQALKSEIDALSDTLKENQDELEGLEDKAGKAGDAGNDMVSQIEDALTAAALAATLQAIGEAALEMADNFSEAESVIVKATGATGEQLDSLTESMMKVYATVDDADMSNTAGAIGEINTRLGLQGEELENVTSLFMQYADNTNSEVVSAVGNVTKVMKNWGVEVDGTELLLDKLTYAAQASGAGVDYLSDMVVTNKSMLQQMGYSLDESIGLMAMFEYEGLNASSIMMGFRSAITNFSSEGLDASTALQDVINKISSMASESEATALSIETFGSRAGSELAFAIRNGKFEIEEWTSAIADAEGTLASTDDAADTMADKWTMASNSMNTAFTSVLAPSIESASEGLAGFVQDVGDFLNEHPAVVAAITAVGVGLIALAGYIIVAKVAALASTGAFAAMGAAVWAATGPVGLIVAGVAALVAGIAILVSWIGEQNKEFNELSATSKQHYEQLEELNAEYEEAVELYGENSAQAQQLAADIAGLEAVYESTKMTLEEFIAQNDALIESHNEVVNSFNESTAGFDAEENSAQSLMMKLEELSGQSTRTAGEQQQMEAIVGRLSELYPDLALSIDETTGSLEQSVDMYRKMAEAELEEQRVAARYESYLDLLSDQLELNEQLTKATEERAAAQERYDNASDWDKTFNVGNVKSDLEDLTAEEERLQAALGETNSLLTEHENAFEEAAETAKESAAYDEWAANVQTTAANVESAIANLNEVWKDAYDSAYESISGQVGLFQELDTEIEASVQKMTETWDSHTEYLNNYSANISAASEVFNTDLVNSLSDGSEESAAYLDSMVSKYDELVAAYGADSSEVQAYLTEVNGAFEERQAAMEQWSTTVADTSSEVATALDETQTAIDEFAQGLEMSDEAAQYGGETAKAYVDSLNGYLGEIQTAFDNAGKNVDNLDESAAAGGYGTSIGSQYATGISSQLGAVTTAAKSLADAVSNALSGSNVSVTASVNGYASGTLSAEPGVALVGEEGPELINFKGGEVVYTADETQRLLSGANKDQYAMASGNTSMSNGVAEKKITLVIQGSGAINIGGVDKGMVLGILIDNLKPVLLNILAGEVFEEGDLPYDF